METKNIDQEIQKAEGYVKGIRSQIETEQARLQAFGSKEEFYSFLCKEKEALNALEILKSKKRTAIMQAIADQEILPRVEALKNTSMNEEKRIQTVMEISLFSETIRRIKTNFIFFERTGEVLFETLDPQLQTIYGEKREEVKTYLKTLPNYETAEVRDEKMVLKNPGQPIIVNLPYKKAISLERENKGKITEARPPTFSEMVREDTEPGAMESLRRMNLGSPIEVNGEISVQARNLQKRSFSGRVEISVAGLSQFVQDRDVAKILKKYE